MLNSKLLTSINLFFYSPATIFSILLLVATSIFDPLLDQAYAEACKTSCSAYGFKDIINNEKECTASCDCPGDFFEKYTIQCAGSTELICCNCPAIITPTPTPTPTVTPTPGIQIQGVVIAR